MEGVRIEGWVMARERGARPRLRILVRAVEGMAAPPRYVRISAPSLGALAPGRAVRCRASLFPPDGPLVPGAYDFARRAYFQELGAVGFIWGRCRPAAFGAPAAIGDRALLAIAALRGDLAQTVYEAHPGGGGALAAALITGDESYLDEDTNASLRDSGLGHLISVSGLHMGIVGGLVFGALSLAFALMAPLALRWPVKKLAAAGALIALGLYLLISGMSVPAIRAYVMACVAFGAILIDRPALTMRGLALAMFIIVLIYPESVLEPGFQMSFAATAALVAAFEALTSRPRVALPSPGLLIGSLNALSRSGGGVLATSLVAGLATDPFALFHFQRFASYGLIANLAVAPIVTFAVAPAAVLAAVLAPFGLAQAPLDWMARALALISEIGAVFGARPEAIVALPKPPDIFLPLTALGIAWACLWRGALRWGALLVFVAAILAQLGAPAPAVAFDAELRAILVREPSGAWRLVARVGRSHFARDRIGQQLGLTPARLGQLAEPDGCSDSVCTWRTPLGRRAALAFDARGAAWACGHADLVVTAHLIARPNCAAALIIDGRTLTREGGAMITENADGFVTRTARPAWLKRPWILRAPPPAQL